MTTVIRKELVRSTNPYGRGDTQCVGAIYRQNGLDIPDIMLWEELTITLDTDTLLVDTEGACIVNNDQIRIGCRDTDLCCIYSGDTLFWTAPTKLERCRFHQIRRSTGIVFTGVQWHGDVHQPGREHDPTNTPEASPAVWRGNWILDQLRQPVSHG
jgi:hypothetical protein